MKRILTICLAIIVLVSGSSFATITRLTTLGQQFQIVMDQANVLYYPSRLLNYPKLAVGEFGYINSSVDEPTSGIPAYTSGMEFRDLGIHWQFGSGDGTWVLGTYFHNAEVEGGLVNFPGGWGSYDYILNEFEDFDLLPNKRIDVIWAKNVGGKPFGVHFGWVNSSQSEEFDGGDAGTYSQTESFSKYKLGLGMTSVSGNTDVALNFEFWSVKDENSALNGSGDYTKYDETQSDGNYQFSLSGRHFMPQSNNYTLVPHAMIGYQKTGWKWGFFDGTDQVISEKENTTILAVNVGGGLNWTPTSDVLALIDMGIDYSHFSFKQIDDPDGTADESKANGTGLALFYFKAGAEATIFPWLTGRLGATTNWDWNSYTQNIVEGSDGSTYKSRYSSNDTYVGLGFLWGGWHIDSYIDPAWFLNGPYFLTGESNSMNWQISVLRPFE